MGLGALRTTVQVSQRGFTLENVRFVSEMGTLTGDDHPERNDRLL